MFTSHETLDMHDHDMAAEDAQGRIDEATREARRDYARDALNVNYVETEKDAVLEDEDREIYITAGGLDELIKRLEGALEDAKLIRGAA